MKEWEFPLKKMELYLEFMGRTGMAEGYLRYAAMFSVADRNKKGLETHHVLPRCCGGTDDPANLVRVTEEHHTKLHKMILLSKLSETELKRLKFAYAKRSGKAK